MLLNCQHKCQLSDSTALGELVSNNVYFFVLSVTCQRFDQSIYYESAFSYLALFAE